MIIDLSKCCCIAGVMLLPRSRPPAGAGEVGRGAASIEALPDMSLFHNLKLKRRKVDSRGSSDGESQPLTLDNSYYTPRYLVWSVSW